MIIIIRKKSQNKVLCIKWGSLYFKMLRNLATTWNAFLSSSLCTQLSSLLSMKSMTTYHLFLVGLPIHEMFNNFWAEVKTLFTYHLCYGFLAFLNYQWHLFPMPLRYGSYLPSTFCYIVFYIWLIVSHLIYQRLLLIK